jgi:hypothetical protein
LPPPDGATASAGRPAALLPCPAGGIRPDDEGGRVGASPSPGPHASRPSQPLCVRADRSLLSTSHLSSLTMGRRLVFRNSDEPRRPCIWSQREAHRRLTKSADRHTATPTKSWIAVPVETALATPGGPGPCGRTASPPPIRYPISRCCSDSWDIPWGPSVDPLAGSKPSQQIGG